jgi:protein SCO1/2
MRVALVIAGFATLMFVSLLSVDNIPLFVARQSPLPKIGTAPEFALTSQHGTPVALSDFLGRVVAVTFIFTRCTDTCPVLTPMMSFVQDRLGHYFGKKIVFVSVTVDPDHDTPQVLKEYAEAFGADPEGWFFVTGAPTAIREVTRRYGVFTAKVAEGGAVDHTFLTSVIDVHGTLRVQYLGVRFDPEEFRRDLVSLAEER